MKISLTKMLDIIRLQGENPCRYFYLNYMEIMMKKGFSLVELLIVLLVLAGLLALVIPHVVVSRNKQVDQVNQEQENDSFYSAHNSGTYECVKKYTFTYPNHYTAKRVDLLKIDGSGLVEVFVCDDDWEIGVDNSADMFAQFREGHVYQVNSVGQRVKGSNQRFPIVMSVQKVQITMENPIAPQAEVNEDSFLQ